MTKNLKEILKSSIKDAESEIMCCLDELVGVREIDNLHRSTFHYIAGTVEQDESTFYFDCKKPEYQDLRENAKRIIEERDKEYDTICKKYVKVEDVIRIFQDCADKGDYSFQSNLVDLKEGKLISGDIIINYTICLLKQTGSEKGFEDYKKISDENLNSDFRKKSVQEEIRIFQKYVQLCKKLSDLD
jgi:hypothetical protein